MEISFDDSSNFLLGLREEMLGENEKQHRKKMLEGGKNRIWVGFDFFPIFNYLFLLLFLKEIIFSQCTEKGKERWGSSQFHYRQEMEERLKFGMKYDDGWTLKLKKVGSFKFGSIGT